MEKVDLKKELASYRARPGRIDVVDVPPQRFLAIDGAGDPNVSREYSDAVSTLFPVAYALKFVSRGQLDRDYVVPPLEALWWADDMAAFTDRRDKSAWSWTAMILIPAWVGDDLVDAARMRSADAPAIERLRVLALDEGRCLQTLHVGPYDAEAEVLARMHDEVIPGMGARMTGRHHEIYLSDARRTAPDRLRTILRQPIADA